MDRSLIDTSSLLNIRRATKRPGEVWARATLRNLLAYRASFPELTVSGFTVFEFLNGMYRGSEHRLAEQYLLKVIPTYDVIFPDLEILDLGAKINAALAGSRQSIGVVDSLIAATALSRNLRLITANMKHFYRVISAGFPLSVTDWRTEAKG